MPELSVGSEIAGCRIEAVAGRGGMGVVYRATQLALERPVALKVITPELADSQAFRARFQRESLIAASIEHPNAIPVYEAGERDGVLYLVMRYVEGTDLRALLAHEGPLDARRAVELLAPVASALHAAHRRGLVHRDVKPANVLIARDDEEGREHVYLTDFGIARHAEAAATTDATLTGTGAFVGTLDYMAPERIQGDSRGDARSDVYAFGCMLFQSLAGRVPYPRENDLAKLNAHLNDPFPSVGEERGGVPAELDAVLRHATAKAPEGRFATAGELAQALARAVPAAPVATETAPPTEAYAPPTVETVAEEPATAALGAAAPTAPPPTPPPPATVRRAPSRRPPWLLPAAGVFAVVVVAGVALALLSGDGGNDSGGSRFSDRPAPAAPRLVAARTDVFRASVPAGWSRSDEDRGRLQRTVWRDPRDSATSVLIDAIPGVRSTAEGRAASVRGGGTFQTGYRELAFRPITLAGRPGFEWQYQAGGRQKVDYFLNDCEDGFAVLGNTSPGKFASLAATFRQVAESLRSLSCP
jgi:serine/threonine protein kinase